MTRQPPIAEKSHELAVEALRNASDTGQDDDTVTASVIDAALNEELVAKILHYISSSTPWDELRPGQRTAARSDARVFRGAILGRRFYEEKP